MRTASLLVLAVVGAAACGDPDTNDDRGYTKAPLEHPTLAIRGEKPSDISKYGAPNRVTAEVIEVPDEPETSSSPTEPQAAPDVELPEGVTTEMVAQGQQVYSGPGNCMACHGPTAGGTPLAPALNDAQWLNIDGSFDALVELIAVGVPAPKQHPAPMPARGGGQINDEQVRQVAAYVYSISR